MFRGVFTINLVEGLKSIIADQKREISFVWQNILNSTPNQFVRFKSWVTTNHAELGLLLTGFFNLLYVNKLM